MRPDHTATRTGAPGGKFAISVRPMAISTMHSTHTSHFAPMVFDSGSPPVRYGLTSSVSTAAAKSAIAARMSSE